MDDIAAIRSVLQTYFDGLYEGNADKLAAAFDETSDLRSVKPDGSLAVLTRQQWLDWVRTRPSPASQGLARDDRIVTLDQSGPATAFAKVNCQVPPRYFTDYLSLARLAGGWRIVAKTFHTDTR